MGSPPPANLLRLTSGTPIDDVPVWIAVYVPAPNANRARIKRRVQRGRRGQRHRGRDKGFHMRVVALVFAALLAIAARADGYDDWWVACEADGWEGGSTPARYAAIWPDDDPLGLIYFRTQLWTGEWVLMGPNLYRNGFVCWRLSDGLEYQIVADYYLQRWYLCEWGLCWFVGAGWPEGVDPDGVVWGATAAVNGVGCVWFDDGAERHDFPQWRSVRERTRDYAQVRTFAGATLRLPRYDFNCDGVVNMMDVDQFVVAVVTGELGCNTYGARFDADVNPFLDIVLGLVPAE